MPLLYGYWFERLWQLILTMEDAPVLPRTNRSVLDAYQNDALGEMDLFRA